MELDNYIGIIINLFFVKLYLVNVKSLLQYYLVRFYFLYISLLFKVSRHAYANSSPGTGSQVSSSRAQPYNLLIINNQYHLEDKW